MTLKVGDTHEAIVVEDIKRTHIVKYAGASGDFNPLHHDDTYAREPGGYPSVFGHGMYSMGLTGRALTDWLGVDRLKTFGVRFTRQVWPGDTLVTEGWKLDGGRIALQVKVKERDEIVCGAAYATASS